MQKPLELRKREIEEQLEDITQNDKFKLTYNNLSSDFI